MVRAGLTPYQALLSGTRNMAEHLGISDESGTVAVGKRADLVLLAGNPLQDVRHTLHSAGVMVGGRWFTSEALAQRLGGVGESLRELIAEQKQRIYEDDAKTVIGALWWGQFDHDDFSSAQRASLDSIETSYKTRLAALADSVASSPNAPNESPQVLRLAARQLKEQREILTPEQQAVFDATARAWMKQYSD